MREGDVIASGLDVCNDFGQRIRGVVRARNDRHVGIGHDADRLQVGGRIERKLPIQRDGCGQSEMMQ
jgi:hypothetical protein